MPTRSRDTGATIDSVGLIDAPALGAVRLQAETLGNSAPIGAGDPDATPSAAGSAETLGTLPTRSIDSVGLIDALALGARR